MLSTLLLLAAPALADAAPCYVYAAASVPSAGQADVPVDVQPAILFEGCGQATYAIALLDADTGTEITRASYTWDGANVLGELSLPTPLAPDHAYDLVVLDGDYAAETISFTTGSAEAQGFSGGPTGEGVDGQVTFNGGTLYATIMATPVTDPDEGSLLLVTDPSLSGAVIGGAGNLVGTNAANIYAQRPADTNPGSWCLDLWQRDIRGERHAGVLSCVEVEEVTSDGGTAGCMGGCGGDSASPPPDTGLALLVGLGSLTLGRRRRR